MTNDYTATLPRKRMGAAVLLSDHDGRVLLVEPTYKDYWEIPGGSVEADESPYTAVVREIREELGLVHRQEATERLSELLARRIAAAVRARAEGTAIYLENGFLVA